MSMVTYKTTTEIPYIGREVEVVVYGDYSPEEPAIIHPVDNAYPGCGEELEICRVYFHIPGVKGANEEEVTMSVGELLSETDYAALVDIILNDKENWE